MKIKNMQNYKIVSLYLINLTFFLELDEMVDYINNMNM